MVHPIIVMVLLVNCTFQLTMQEFKGLPLPETDVGWLACDVVQGVHLSKKAIVVEGHVILVMQILVLNIDLYQLEYEITP